MSRATAGRLLLAVLATASLAVAPAAAQVGHDDAPTPVPDVPILLEWDGDEPATGTTAFLGAPVVAPGDSAARTVTVHNGGPTAARLRVSVVNVSLLDAAAAEAAGVPSFYDDLSVTWQTARDSGASSFTELAAHGSTTISEVPVEHGGSTRLTIGYAFAADATSGNRADVARQAASFDLRLELGPDLTTGAPTDAPTSAPSSTAPVAPTTIPGATPASPASPAVPTGAPSEATAAAPTGAPGEDGPPPSDGAGGPLTMTGAPVRAVVLAALVAAATGLAVLAAARRRAALAEPEGTLTSED